MAIYWLQLFILKACSQKSHAFVCKCGWLSPCNGKGSATSAAYFSLSYSKLFGMSRLNWRNIMLHLCVTVWFRVRHFQLGGVSGRPNFRPVWKQGRAQSFVHSRRIRTGNLRYSLRNAGIRWQRQCLCGTLLLSQVTQFVWQTAEYKLSSELFSRLCAGFADAAGWGAVLTILLKLFPTKVPVIMSYTEGFFGVGFMIGKF